MVALAPVGRTNNIANKALKKAAPHWQLIEFAAARTHAYNILGVNWWASEAELLFCAELGGICSSLLEAIGDADDSVDNMDRFSNFLADLPAGNPYQNLAYFAQTTISDDWYRFDYGRIENKSKYGQFTPPKIPLENLDIPVALIQGSLDELADPTDVEWLAQ